MEKQLNTTEIAVNSFTLEDLCSELPVSAMLAKSAVPYSHRRIADNYIVMKKIYGFQVAQPRITNSERSLLYKYKMNTLDSTTIGCVNL